MGKKITNARFDDLDWSPLELAPSITFGLAGKTYEIDLSDENRERLRAALAPFIKVARRAPARRTGGRGR